MQVISTAWSVRRQIECMMITMISSINIIIKAERESSKKRSEEDTKGKWSFVIMFVPLQDKTLWIWSLHSVP
jgi:hypothetical protein